MRTLVRCSIAAALAGAAGGFAVVAATRVLAPEPVCIPLEFVSPITGHPFDEPVAP